MNIPPPDTRAGVRSEFLGLGFEKLDRDLFDPAKAYPFLAGTGVSWIRLQSGWQRTERAKGVYDFAWLDAIVDSLLDLGLRHRGAPSGRLRRAHRARHLHPPPRSGPRHPALLP